MTYTPFDDAHAPPNAADAKYSDAYAPSLDVETARAVLHLKEKWQAEIRSRLREVEAERDALAAHVERLRQALQNIDSDLEGRNFLEKSSLRDTARSALNAEPTTSLAGLNEEEVEKHFLYGYRFCRANGFLYDNQLREAAGEYVRRQAKGGER